MIARAHPSKPCFRAGTLLCRAVIWFVLLATLVGVGLALFQRLPANLLPSSGGADWATLGLLAAGTVVVFVLCQALTSPVRNENERRGADGGAAPDLDDHT